MNLLSILFATIQLTPAPDTGYAKLHIEIDNQPVNVVRISQSNDEYFDSSFYQNLPKATGGSVFDFEVKINKGTFLTIDINRECFIPCVFNVRDSLSIKVRRTPKGSWYTYDLKFSGSNSIAEQIYMDRFFPPGKVIHPFADIAKQSKSYSEYYVSAKAYIDNLVAVWDSLRLKDAIAENSYQLYKSDTKAILYSEAVKKLAMVKTDTSWQTFSKWQKLRTALFFHGDASNKLLLKTPFGIMLHAMYLTSILKEDDAIADTMLKNTISGYFYYYDSSYREQSWGHYLLRLKQLYPSTSYKADILDREVFRAYYPESKYIKQMDSVQSTILKARQALGEKVDIHAGYPQTMQAIFENLSGRYFFIDTWATWCSPCIQEFNHYNKLSKFLIAKNVKQVFLSIDRIEDKDKWKKYIEEQHISGSHFMLPDVTQRELLNIISEGKNQASLTIPRYLLYDKTLAKYFIDLPRPSSGEVLETFIENIIQTK